MGSLAEALIYCHAVWDWDGPSLWAAEKSMGVNLHHSVRVKWQPWAKSAWFCKMSAAC
jgi:hypothetical protein